jgi:2-polyprenyl-6-methoxyphenol hydroxylase-like FAD-dependent oxidoreductase
VVYRQTGNLRRHYDKVRNWPDGLVVIGDALCAFNPVYGQGISVAACEAVLLRQTLDGGAPAAGDTRRLLRRFAALLELPWAVATGEDMRYPSSGAQQNLRQRLLLAWSRQLGLLAVHGNGRAQDTMSRVYHLMGAPAEMFHPALLAAAVRARVLGHPGVLTRPSAVVALGGT